MFVIHFVHVFLSSVEAQADSKVSLKIRASEAFGTSASSQVCSCAASITFHGDLSPQLINFKNRSMMMSVMVFIQVISNTYIDLL